MNLTRADQIAKAVLYEGYMLYPYRPSSVKNRQRWNFGVLYAPAFSDLQGGEEACSMRNEFLVCGNAGTTLEMKLRFLHLQTRSAQVSSRSQSALPAAWQEAVEREVSLPDLRPEKLCREPLQHTFEFASGTQVDPEHDSDGEAVGEIVRRQEAIRGTIDISAEAIAKDLYKIGVIVRNATPLETCPSTSRDEALLRSLVSTHTILGVEGGEFVSLLEPPDDLQELAKQCQNVGAWPVLVGDAGQRDTLLASPIILYDYPQIAPESAGDLFDGTEIDEILSLRIMTLTDDEKSEIRQSDTRARQILERTDAMPVEQFMKLHGVVRGLRLLPVPPPREDLP